MGMVEVNDIANIPIKAIAKIFQVLISDLPSLNLPAKRNAG
jgi:hypothetical protein